MPIQRVSAKARQSARLTNAAMAVGVICRVVLLTTLICNVFRVGRYRVGIARASAGHPEPCLRFLDLHAPVPDRPPERNSNGRPCSVQPDRFPLGLRGAGFSVLFGDSIAVNDGMLSIAAGGVSCDTSDGLLFGASSALLCVASGGTALIACSCRPFLETPADFPRRFLGPFSPPSPSAADFHASMAAANAASSAHS